MSKIDKRSWDERFSADEYVYGTDPNVFFREQLDKLNPGKLLLLGEGEGRNGVYAAKMNWEVDAVDLSDQAKVKALKLAEREHVQLNYEVHNLTEYKPKRNYYDAIGIIFFHLEKADVVKIFSEAKKALKKGGVIISEVFSINQIGRTSGGPKDPDLLYKTSDFEKAFKELETIQLEESLVELNEGRLHQGEAMVVRYVGENKL
ncbi:MAG: class I SAM-dependent methyltransferase [Ignavibacteriaceae bacterium]|nr:class I SAM-dependent methyltransferase [Ignavibacteriaceae bacterium]